MNKEGYQTDILKSTATFISVLLPVIQFAFVWLPKEITSIFLAKELFFFTSLLTLLLCYCVILSYRLNPFFEFTLMRTRNKLYKKHLATLNELTNSGDTENAKPAIERPFFFNGKNISYILILLTFFAGSVFIYLGLEYRGDQNIPVAVQLTQAMLYSLTILFSIFVFTTYVIQQQNTSRWELTQAERGLRAVNLAKELNAFIELPEITLVGCYEANFSNVLTTEVIVNGEKKYHIRTDGQAKFLHGVKEITDENLHLTSPDIWGY